MATVGRACLILALATCVYGIAASLYGARAHRPDWAESGRRSVYALAVLSTVAFAILEIAFLTSDFSFSVVSTHSSTTTPFFYRVAASWSSQEGSLLLWLWLLSMWSSLVLFLTRRRLRDVAPYATAVLLGFGAFFTALLVFAVPPVSRVPPPRPRLAAQPVRRAGRAAAGGRGAEPAAAPSEHDDPPPDALLGVHAVRGAVRVRRGRAARPPRGRRVDPFDAPVRARRLVPARRRDPARRALVLQRAGVGRLLGLGPGRERVADAVADRHRVPALGDDPGEARDAEGLERLARARHRRARRPRDVPGAQRDPRLDPRLRRLDAGQAVRRLHRAAGARLDRAGRLAPRSPALRGAAGLAAEPRGHVPGQQHRARRAVLRRLLGHLLPADLRGGHRREGLGRAAVVRPLHRA